MFWRIFRSAQLKLKREALTSNRFLRYAASPASVEMTVRTNVVLEQH